MSQFVILYLFSFKGLFQRAILQSGTALCPWAMNENHMNYAQKIGETFRCSMDDGTEAYLKCMQSIHSDFLLLYILEKIVSFDRLVNLF